MIPAQHHHHQQNTKEQETISVIQEMSDRLETGLNEEALKAIVDLLKAGTHPDAVVAVVTSLAQKHTR